jgi:hypothetical protein
MADQLPRGQGLSRDQLEHGDQCPGSAVEKQGLGRVAGHAPPQPQPFEVAYHHVEIPHAGAHLSWVRNLRIAQCKQTASCASRYLLPWVDYRFGCVLVLAQPFNPHILWSVKRLAQYLRLRDPRRGTLQPSCRRVFSATDYYSNYVDIPPTAAIARAARV